MPRRVLCLAFALVLLIGLTIPVLASSDNGDTIVYITATGKKYHKETCGYLHSKYEITLREAVKEGYKPCSRCHPPSFNGTLEEKAKINQEKSATTKTASSSTKNGSTKSISVVSQKSILSDMDFWIYVILPCAFFLGCGIYRLIIYLKYERTPKKRK